MLNVDVQERINYLFYRCTNSILIIKKILTNMKNLIIFTIIFSFIVFTTSPNVFGESEIENEVKEAAN